MTLLDALQTTLEGEHAAVYVYGVLGARTSSSAEPELFAEISDGYAAHRARRDQLRSVVFDEGETPVASEPAYELRPRSARPTRCARRRWRSSGRVPRRTPGWSRTRSRTSACGR